MTKRASYPTDLTNAEWVRLERVVPSPKSGGRPAKHTRREIMNAIFYVVRTGCQWRMLPHDLPPWPTAYHYFRTWQRDGTWRRIHDALHQQVRQATGRQSQPSAAILDSQSVKTTEKGGRAASMQAKK